MIYNYLEHHKLMYQTVLAKSPDLVTNVSNLVVPCLTNLHLANDLKKLHPTP